MKARETFATSGPRIKVRLFGGVELPAKPANAATLVEQGYELGVPMGGDLGPTGAAPTFTVYAMKDPDGANLDRIQIIKGWVGKDGNTHEQIVDTAWSGDRQPGADGKLPPVGNTVDLKTAKFTNDIGASSLMGSWTDEQFDPEQHAFITPGLSKSQHRAGAPMMRYATTCPCLKMYKPPSRNAPGRRPSGTGPDSKH